MSIAANMKTTTALTKIRAKIASDDQPVQLPEPKKHAERKMPVATETAKRKVQPLPKCITFPTFFRTYAGQTFANYAEFARLIDGSGWNIDKIVYPESCIRIDVPVYLRSKGESLFLDLMSGGEAFTSGELFYKIHKALVEPCTHDFFCLRGAKLVASPYFADAGVGKQAVYGFYSSDEYAPTKPQWP